MNTPKRSAVKAIPILFAVNVAAVLPLLTGCGKEKVSNTPVEPIAVTQPTLPPITANQMDMAPTPAAEPTNTVAANVLPAPAATNTPAVTPTPAARGAASEGAREYTVARGDTLYKIARVNKVKVTALTKANPSVDFAKLKAGQKIKLPAASATPAAAGLGLREPGADTGNIHVVKAGETLTQLAKLNHTTIKAIQEANGLKTTRVNVGQKIKIPTGAQATPASSTPKPTNAPKPATTT